MRKTAIIGSGISSLAAAYELSKNGVPFDIFEKSQDLAYPPESTLFIRKSQISERFDPKNDLISIVNDIELVVDNQMYSYRIPEDDPIYIIDREKFLRNQWARMKFSKFYTKTKIEKIIEGEGRIKLQTNNSVYGGYDFVLIGDGNPYSEYIKHHEKCERKTVSGKICYCPSKNSERKILVYFQTDHINVEGYGNGKIVRLSTQYINCDNCVYSYGYRRDLHTCIPETSENIFILGNMVGTTNYLGNSAAFCMDFSILSTSQSIKGLKNMTELHNLYTDYIKGIENSDPFEAILKKIPIY
ncbi:NAD(P)-binding protein [Caldiplasma sukawensis]